jgi:DNA-directed RNA polymerase subunit alpha
MKRQSLFEADQKSREVTAQRQQEDMLLNQQIEAMELSDRVRKTLMDSGIVRIGDLVDKMEAGDQELLALGGFGPKALEEVKERLQMIGLIPDES